MNKSRGFQGLGHLHYRLDDGSVPCPGPDQGAPCPGLLHSRPRLQMEH